MTARRHEPRPGEWVKVRLPDGRPAMVTTKFDHERGKLVIVRPIKER